MNVFGLFLFGEDDLDDVRAIRQSAISALASGRIVEWTNENSSTTKADGMELPQLIKECDYFIRLYDPVVAAANPIITETVPNLYFT